MAWLENEHCCSTQSAIANRKIVHFRFQNGIFDWNVIGGQSEHSMLKFSRDLTLTANLCCQSRVHSRYSMCVLEEPARFILVVGMNQSDIVSFGFIWLAIVNQEGCSNHRMDLTFTAIYVAGCRYIVAIQCVCSKIPH